jgi:hypothetical protein
LNIWRDDDGGTKRSPNGVYFIGLVAYQGREIVCRFIIEYGSLLDFGPEVIIGLFLYEDF